MRSMAMVVGSNMAMVVGSNMFIMNNSVTIGKTTNCIMAVARSEFKPIRYEMVIRHSITILAIMKVTSVASKLATKKKYCTSYGAP